MRSPLTSFLATASSTDIGGVSQKAKFAILFEPLAPFEAGQRDLPSTQICTCCVQTGWFERGEGDRCAGRIHGRALHGMNLPSSHVKF